VVAHFEEWVTDIVVEALDNALAKERFDWVPEMAVLIPARVIARVMGVAEADRQKIVDWSLAMFHQEEGDETGERSLKIIREIFGFVQVLRAEKLADPQEDMVTVLAQAAEKGEISDNEFLFYCMSLITAGFETTHTLIGQSMRMILEDPEVARIFTETMDTDGAGPLIEEFLRMISPAMNFARTVTKDVEFNGHQLRESDVMQMMYAAANRDPAVFEDPHRFWPGRPNGADHLSFGAGPHRCIGQALARLEVRVLFEQLHQRGVRLELDGEPKRGHSTFINQLAVLPVRVA
jgi:cytochrome P450